MLLKFAPNSNKTNDEYYEPWGVTADPEGLFVVSDHHNHRLQVRLCPLQCLCPWKTIYLTEQVVFLD